MNENNCENNDVRDEILEELWAVKDYYSLTCNSSFEELVRKIKEDIKSLDMLKEQNKLSRVC